MFVFKDAPYVVKPWPSSRLSWRQYRRLQQGVTLFWSHVILGEGMAGLRQLRKLT